MATLSDLTIEQLRAATLTQIRAAVKNKVDSMTKAQIGRLLLAYMDFDAETIFPDAPTYTYEQDNQPKTCLRILRDVLGNKLGSARVEWTYYATRQVNLITLQTLNASDVVITQRRIKHPYNQNGAYCEVLRGEEDASKNNKD